MDEYIIREMINPCLIPEKYTINLTSVQISIDMVNYLVNKMDEYYYDNLIIDIVPLDDMEIILDILLEKIVEYNIMRKITFVGQIDYYIKFINNLLVRSKVEKYSFYQMCRYKDKCICKGLYQLKDKFIGCRYLRTLNIYCRCDLNKTIMTEVIMTNENINVIKIDHLFFNYFPKCLDKYGIIDLYRGYYDENEAENCCWDYGKFIKIMESFVEQIKKGRQIRKLSVITCFNYNCLFENALDKMVRTLMIQNDIKSITIYPKKIHIPIEILMENTSLTKINDRWYEYMIKINRKYIMLIKSIYCMLKYTKYESQLIHQKRHKTLFMDNLCLLPKPIILKIVGFIKKQDIR